MKLLSLIITILAMDVQQKSRRDVNDIGNLLNTGSRWHRAFAGPIGLVT